MSEPKAIPFVALIDGKFNLTEEAKEFLHTVEAPVSVIAVVGLYRTGKSFLLNRILLEQSDGFQVGPTVNPCTKGLWVWNKVLKGKSKDGSDMNYIVVDTEGIGALDTNSQHDSTIFSLALLLSSFFIYNSVGSIDEGALNNLSLVVNLTKHIHVRSSAAGAEDDGADFAQYFPSFLWLVRDFTLQLVTPDGQAFTSKEYLERALQPAPGFTEQIEAKNRIRRMLTHFFPERDCFTMVRPVTDESLLQRLSSTPSEKLRPEFREQMGALRKLILNKAEPKMMNGTPLDGVALINLGMAYTQAINSGAVPSIQNAWSYICESKCQYALTDALKMYEKEAAALRDSGLPMSVEDLDERGRDMEKKAWAIFQKHAIGSETEGFKRQLEDKMREIFRQLHADNAAKGKQRAMEILEKLYSEVDIKLQEEQYHTFDEYETERKRVRSTYLDEVPNGPAKLEVLTSTMELKLAEAGAKFSSRHALEIQREISRCKAEIDTAQRELLNVKLESEKETGGLKLKLEYAEKYNEDAKVREKECRDEIARLRSANEAALKEAREKAEQELKVQVAAVEERRSKAVAEAQQLEQKLLQYQKDNEKQTALLEQGIEFAKKSAAESQQREAECRRALESLRKDFDSELKALQERLEQDKANLTKQVGTLTDALDKANEATAEWKEKYTTQGAQLQTQIKQLHAEQEAKQQAFAELQLKFDELERSGGHKAMAEKDQMAREIEKLRAKVDDVTSEKGNLQNALTVSNEDRQRLDQQLDGTRKALKETEEKVKRIEAQLDILEREKGDLEDRERRKGQTGDELGKALNKLTKEKEQKEAELLQTISTLTEEIENLKSDRDSKIETLNQVKEELETKLVELEGLVARQKDELERLAAELEEAESRCQQGVSVNEEQYKAKLRDLEEKHKRKLDELNKASQREQEMMKHGFEQEKVVLQERVKSLEKHMQELQDESETKNQEHEATLKEYETAMDELEETHKNDMAEKLGKAEKEYAELEKRSMQIEAELKKTVEGLSSKNEIIERQLAELKSNYKQERQDLELKFSTEMKDYKADAEAKIKRLEQDCSAAMAKNDQLNQDLIKAMDQHNRQCEELNIKLETVQEKIEGEKREIVREAQQRQHELQIENEELRSENKRLENDKLMEQKDHDTERTLLKSHLANLEKQLKDREMVLRDCQESKEAELQEAKLKLQSMKTEDEAKINKEREDARQRLEDIKSKYEEKIREFKEEINVKQTDLKVLEERIEGLKLSEQRANLALADSKARMHEQKEQYNATVKELKESNQTLQKELQDEKSNHQMTQLRAEKQEEWNRRELAQLKDELADKKKLMDNMISKELYKRDMDNLKIQNQTALADTLREKDAEKTKLEGEKKKLEEELGRIREQLKKALTDGALTESKQKELAKLASDRDRVAKELLDCRNDLDSARKQVKAKEEDVRRKEADLQQNREGMKLVLVERDDIKKERDELETKVMKLEMELKNIQQIEERKYQVEIMRLKTENEELKRADKKKQMIEPKGAAGDGYNSALDASGPALTSALARVRARRTTSQGMPATGAGAVAAAPPQAGARSYADGPVPPK